MSFIDKAKECDSKDFQRMLEIIESQCTCAMNVCENGIELEIDDIKHYNWLRGRFSAYQDLMTLISIMKGEKQ